MWGLTLDTVVGHDVVLANGTLVHTSATSFPDLFWVRLKPNPRHISLTLPQALRGAAPSFGIITAYHLQTQPAPSSASTYNYGWQFTAAQVAVGLQKFQQFVQSAELPAEWGGEINLAKGSKQGLVSFQLDGAYYGKADPKSIVQPFLTSIVSPTPASASSRAHPGVRRVSRLLRAAASQPATGSIACSVSPGVRPSRPAASTSPPSMTLSTCATPILQLLRCPC